MRVRPGLPVLWAITAGLMLAPAHAAGEANPALPSCAVPGMQDVFVPGPGLYTGGEQTEAQLEKLKDMGVRHVIDLRVADKPGLEPEAKIAARLGLTYRRIPINGPVDLTRANAQALDQAIAAARGEPVLVHCLAGKRSAALMTLREVWIQGRDSEAAIAHWRRAGLRELEPVVMEILNRPQPSQAAAH